METGVVGFRLPRPAIASIGPRIFLRGNVIFSPSLKPSRKPLQLGHGFFSVETKVAREQAASSSPASIGPRIFLRGNSYGASRQSLNGLASIGPRIFLRGNPGRDRRSGGDEKSFNWATDFSPWKLGVVDRRLSGYGALQLGHGFFSVETAGFGFGCALAICRFNWATDFSPWKHLINCAASPTSSSLQLGHGFFSVETGRR